MNLLWLAGWAMTAAQAVCPPPPGQPEANGFARGWPSSAPQPSEAALRLNLDAAALYKQRNYKAAAAKYRQADDIDPQFLAPRLNLAGLLVRQDKHAEAAAVLKTLLHDGFVPWHQQAREATDLAALWARQSETQLTAAVASAAAGWGADVMQGVLMLSRLKPPIRLAPQDGPLPLFPQQEIVSWNPRTGRFLQVTSHNGRVLAFVRAKAGNTVVFVTADKLWRVKGQLVHFEGVAVHVLELPTMQALPPQRIAGLVKQIRIGFDAKSNPKAIVTPPAGPASVVVGQGSGAPVERKPPRLAPAVLLTIAGANPTTVKLTDKPCPLVLADDYKRAPPAPRVRPRRGGPLVLPSRFGLGLAGLPLAGLEPPK